MKRGVVVHPDEVTNSWADRLIGSRVSLLGIHPIGGNQSRAEIEKLFISNSENSVISRLIDAGIGVEYEMHALSWLLDRELFAANPEYFRLDENGVRTPDNNCCCSNKEALSIITERSRLLAKKLPSSTHRYHFWTDDVLGKACHCPECSRLSPSEQAMTLYNAMIDGIRAADSKASLCYLAYYDTRKAPEIVKPAEGIFLEYAPMGRDFKAALADRENEKNISETSYLDGLFKVFGHAGSQALDYWLDNSMYSGWVKPPKALTPDMNILESDISYYDRIGFEYATTFACYLGDDYETLHKFPDLSRFL